MDFSNSSEIKTTAKLQNKGMTLSSEVFQITLVGVRGTVYQTLQTWEPGVIGVLHQERVGICNKTNSHTESIFRDDYFIDNGIT
jgi:hypothetical protein